MTSSLESAASRIGIPRSSDDGCRTATLRLPLRAGFLEKRYPAVAVAGHFSKSVRSGAPGSGRLVALPGYVNNLGWRVGRFDAPIGNLALDKSSLPFSVRSKIPTWRRIPETESFNPHGGKPRGRQRTGEMSEEVRKGFLAILTKPFTEEAEEEFHKFGNRWWLKAGKIRGSLTRFWFRGSSRPLTIKTKLPIWPSSAIRLFRV